MKKAEIAEIFSCSVSTIKKWEPEGFPSKGTLRDMVIWVRVNRPLTTDKTITEARRRKLEAEARLKELDLMIREGQLLPRQEIAAHNSAVIQAAKQQFLLLRRTLPPRLVGLEARQMAEVIKKSIRRILETFYFGINKSTKRR